MAKDAASQAHAYLRYYEQGTGVGFWAAIEKATGAFLGWFHLRPGPDYRFVAQAGYREGDLDLGYRLTRSAWGRGYATEGSRALVRKAFMELGARRVVATALVANGASTRVMEKVGLRPAGEVKLPGFSEPAVTYVLTRDEYLSGLP
jgi:RimJ/RimL family protein N-acetyltransferase